MNKQHYKEPQNRNQVLLFSTLDDTISENNTVRLIDLAIDKIIAASPEKFEWKGCSNIGQKAYSPNTLLKLFIYCYSIHLSGSRRLEKETKRNIELRWLLGELTPDFWTINEFRKKNGKLISQVKSEMVKFLKSEKYIEGKVIAIDGSKFKANASRVVFTSESIDKLLSKTNLKIETYLEEFQRADTLSELEEELDSTTSVCNLNLLDKIAELQAQITKFEGYKETLKETGNKYLAPNDKDANVMKFNKNKMPGYNGQIGVDEKHRMLTFNEISTDGNDIDLLKDGHENIKEELGEYSEELEIDTGFCNFNQLKEIEENSETTCYASVPKSHKKIKDAENGIFFTYDEENDLYNCSGGGILTLEQKRKKDKNRIYSVYRGQNCTGCSLNTLCTKSKKGRMLHRDIDEKWINAFKLRMKQRKARAKLKERKTIVEHVFGTIKFMMGTKHFILCGKEKVQIEFDLYAIGYNLKRLFNVDSYAILSEKINNYAW